jgi:hypothetical protein
MASVLARLTALEATIAELKAENELLKMLTPLEAFTAGLKDASAEQVQAWADACEEVAQKAGVGIFSDDGKTKGKKAKKDAEPKEKKNTNPTGPAEFNILIKATWHEMAAQLGVVSDEHDEAFKKAATAAGVSFAKARAEASRRKAVLEGREVGEKAKKAKEVKTKEVKTKEVKTKEVKPKEVKTKEVKPSGGGGGGSGPAPSLKKPTAEQIEEATPEYDDAARLLMKADCENDGLTECAINGVACWLDVETGKVTSYDGVNMIGAYVMETGEFCAVD